MTQERMGSLHMTPFRRGVRNKAHLGRGVLSHAQKRLTYPKEQVEEKQDILQQFQATHAHPGIFLH